MVNYTLDWLSVDGKLLLTARIVRTFGYGFLSVILSIYLKLIGVNDFLIGVIISTTLLNSIMFTAIASLYAERFGKRRMLMIYAVLMSVSGLIFLFTTNYYLLFLAALIGTINVIGSDTSAFLTIEQAVLPQTTKEPKRRNTLFAFYNMFGTFAMSAGVLMIGFSKFLEVHYNISTAESLKPLFGVYTLIGIVIFFIYFHLSKRIENNEKYNQKSSTLFPVTKSLSPSSKKIVGNLSILFSIDSFAGGFILQSIVALWFYSRFNADLTTLSYIFSIAGVLTAFSYYAAAKIADRFGLINTMVFSHIPANILIIFVAVAPSLPIAIILYLCRMALSQMDVPTRQSYIVSVVKKNERTAAVGITNISRNITQSLSPSIAGFILQSLSFLSAPFIIGGILKIVYDVALYFNFRDIKPEDENE